MYRNKVRIIGGEWRRRLISFPDGEALRPSPDRVRETLFNWLGQELTGQRCLDLFAGSGALGFEAASRGAHVTMVEIAKPVQQALLANKKLLNADGVAIILADARRFLHQDKQIYDVIFADPPFASSLAQDLLPELKEHLRDGGFLYLECGERPDLSGWHVYREGKAGKVQYLLLQKG